MTPPARWKSSMYQEPPGESFTSWGVRAETSLNRVRGISKPAS